MKVEYKQLQIAKDGVPGLESMLAVLLGTALEKPEWRGKDLVAKAIDSIGLPDDLRNATSGSSNANTIENRCWWALFELTTAAMLERPRRGYYQITELGEKLYHEYGFNLTRNLVHQQDAYQAHLAEIAQNNQANDDESDDGNGEGAELRAEDEADDSIASASDAPKDARVEALLPIAQELIEYVDWALAHNGGDYDADKAQDNRWIRGFRKRDKLSEIVIGGREIGWNFGRAFGGSHISATPYLNAGVTNFTYDISDPNHPALRVDLYDDRANNKTTLFATPLSGAQVTADEIRVVARVFWQEVDKHPKEEDKVKTTAARPEIKAPEIEKYARALTTSANVIFRGAPGTGKTYLAKMVAAYIISGHTTTSVKDLTAEEKTRLGFVQFHPSYDYTDFVEGLRPHVSKKDEQMTFRLEPGTFKAFLQDAIDEQTANGDAAKPYVFIIDEINRGEIGKIFGELFYAIDPGYRGPAGAVSTQYANLHASDDADADKLYVPENVYILGTMNDIDRSVDSFDFAMRRRFRFMNITADERKGMLSELKNKQNLAQTIMTDLNVAIEHTDGLNENYDLGPSYFLKLSEISPAELWSQYLEPLLAEYIRGMVDDQRQLEAYKAIFDAAVKKAGATSQRGDGQAAGVATAGETSGETGTSSTTATLVAAESDEPADSDEPVTSDDPAKSDETPSSPAATLTTGEQDE
ncbi:winged helix-turn-helix domain-containing protein [Lacticaseibacillus mingshuiensis]|uniref:Winged helix-turn-helix domain-containing protein n=1 Tax=Lacticaseibacillus mingshuiensis TaxID=2799574 RepID=A0ABW4CG27_9LACO|nr:winged helix-turn-helix domain-containing protein [Lacticaseibacillus mingshuiensis]